MEYKITSQIKFEVGDFADRCLQIYKENIDAGIKKSYEELYDRIQSQVKSQIMQTIGTKDMFDYSKLPDVSYNDPGQPPAHMDLPKFMISLHANAYDVALENAKKEFMKFIPEEKVVICVYIWIVLGENRYGEKYVITNYARCLGFRQDNRWGTGLMGYQELKFWIPTDIINILSGLLKNNGNPTSQPPIIYYNSIVAVLQMVKDRLYDRKIIPLYVRDVMEENASLKEKYDQYATDRIALDTEKREFEVKRTHFEEYIKPYTDVEKEKEEILAERQRLQLEREKLRLIAKKIQLEREKLDRDREAIDKIDITNI